METLNLILTHQGPEAVARMLTYWRQAVAEDSIWLAYGGKRENFDRLEHPRKVFIDSPRLRTVDHQRERQSYIALFRALAAEPIFQEVRYIHLAEYDQIPLLQGINHWQARYLEEQKADLIAYYLQRIDKTNSAHYLMHWTDDWFRDFLRQLSVREQWKAVYALKGYGTFWRREAWEAVARVREPGPIYLEQWMPTVAHHLGYRLRPIPHDPEKRVKPPSTPAVLDAMTPHPEQSQWFVHPVTDLWLK